MVLWKLIFKISKSKKYQQILFYLIERSDRSILGKILAFVFLFFVVLSICTMCLETVVITDIKTSNKLKPFVDYFNIEDNENKSLEENKRLFFILELVCNIVFTIEITMRLLATDQKVIYMKRFANIVDTIAIFPFWLTLGLQLIISIGDKKLISESTGSYLDNLYVLRILRLTRILRIFKLSRHIKALNIIGKIFIECIYEISLLGAFFAMNIIVFSSLMYHIEYQVMGNESPFISIPETFW